MPVTLTKAEMNKILVAERKKSRSKAVRSKFMSRTLSIYNGQKKRLAESRADDECDREKLPPSLPYTLAEFRDKVDAALTAGECPYSGQKLTVTNMTADHDTPIARGGAWSLDNIVVCTTQSNFRKGQMTGAEYKKFANGLRKSFEPIVCEDIFRRLTLGGKWSFR